MTREKSTAGLYMLDTCENHAEFEARSIGVSPETTGQHLNLRVIWAAAGGGNATVQGRS